MSSATPPAAAAGASSGSMRLTNVFALVEQFAYCHSSSELESPNPPPSLLREI